jgi:hypothetical protein
MKFFEIDETFNEGESVGNNTIEDIVFETDISY